MSFPAPYLIYDIIISSWVNIKKFTKIGGKCAHYATVNEILGLPRFCFHIYASQNAVSMQWFGKKIISVIQILHVLIAIYILVSMRRHCLKVCQWGFFEEHGNAFRLMAEWKWWPSAPQYFSTAIHSISPPLFAVFLPGLPSEQSNLSHNWAIRSPPTWMAAIMKIHLHCSTPMTFSGENFEKSCWEKKKCVIFQKLYF